MQAHDDRNLARQLTPAEKKEKKTRKLLGAAAEGEACPVSVYRIGSLASAQNRFKVRVNAEVRSAADLVKSLWAVVTGPAPGSMVGQRALWRCAACLLAQRAGSQAVLRAVHCAPYCMQSFWSTVLWAIICLYGQRAA